jgi:hypothetical protein
VVRDRNPPAGKRTKAHVHEQHESAFYFLSGDEIELWIGARLQHCEKARPGDYLFILANVPHVAVNRGSQPAVFVGARNEATAQESVIMHPELDSAVPRKAIGVQQRSRQAPSIEMLIVCERRFVALSVSRPQSALLVSAMSNVVQLRAAGKKMCERGCQLGCQWHEDQVGFERQTAIRLPREPAQGSNWEFQYLVLLRFWHSRSVQILLAVQ